MHLLHHFCMMDHAINRQPENEEYQRTAALLRGQNGLLHYLHDLPEVKYRLPRDKEETSK